MAVRDETLTRASGERGGWFERLTHTCAPGAVILIRLVVGAVFLSEGIQKFLFPDRLGPGRFAAETPLPAPAFFAYLDGVFEIGCGMLLIVGLLTRAAAVPMIVNMLGAIAFTKIPKLLDDGWWTFAHDSRTDFAMLFGSVFLLVVGAGRYSLDARLTGRPGPRHPPARRRRAPLPAEESAH